MKIKLFFLSLLLLTSVRAQAQSETLRVWLDSNVTLTADSTSVAYLTLYENDGAQGYTSFNMSLIVPKGIHVNKVQQGRDLLDDISLSERATATHTIACNMPADTLLKVACTSSTNQDLYTDDAEGNPLDSLWTIGLIAEPTMVNGDYVVKMPAKGLVFNMKQGDTYVSSRISEDVTCVFTVKGGVISGIRTMTGNAPEGALYDLNGRRVNEPTGCGVYIDGGKKVLK